jgi:sulfite exporter TauE/SafE
MITAVLLGFMGSLHCAGMCGPLVLLTPVVGRTRGSILASRLVYHAGRIAVYSLIGLLFGAVGRSIVFAGFQQWISLIAGASMLSALFLTIRFKANLTRVPVRLKSLFGSFIHKRSYFAIFTLGAINGLLPCGLVYMAATASMAQRNVSGAMAYMSLFGVGTIPILLAISFAGGRLPFARSAITQKLVPLTIAFVAILLIVRSDPASLIWKNGSHKTCPLCSAR